MFDRYGLVASGGHGDRGDGASTGRRHRLPHRVLHQERHRRDAADPRRRRRALDLDAPITDFVPAFGAVTLPTPDSPVPTVRMLLTMSAGFPTDDPWADRQESISDAELDEVLRGGLLFDSLPGTRFAYSNLGYALLGRVVAVVDGAALHRGRRRDRAPSPRAHRHGVRARRVPRVRRHRCPRPRGRLGTPADDGPRRVLVDRRAVLDRPRPGALGDAPRFGVRSARAGTRPGLPRRSPAHAAGDAGRPVVRASRVRPARRRTASGCSSSRTTASASSSRTPAATRASPRTCGGPCATASGSSRSRTPRRPRSPRPRSRRTTCCSTRR